jgi:sugar/nucleoside kinase (ribokinase family)
MNRILDRHPVLHLNEEEALRFTRCQSVEQAGTWLRKRTGNTVLITCGAEGCLVFEQGETSAARVAPFPVGNGGDTIGAGDSHIGSVIALLHLGYGMVEAVRGANRVAAAVVSKKGANLGDEAFAALSGLL